MNNPPMRPCVSGTFPLADLGAKYTIGRDHVQEPALRLADTSRPLSVDIETVGLGRDSRRIKAVTVGDAHHAVILDPRDEFQADLVRKCLSSASAIAIHNTTFDVPSLVYNGLMQVADVEKVWDTMIWARLAEPGDLRGYKLINLAVRYLGASKNDQLTKAFSAAGFKVNEGFAHFDLNRPIYVHGAAMDVITTARLFPLVRSAAIQRIKNNPYKRWAITEPTEVKRLLDREQRINRMFLRRQCKGIRVDLEFLENYRKVNAAEMAEHVKTLNAAGITVWSTATQLLEIVERDGAIPANYPRTDSGASWSGEADDLEKIQHPLVKEYLAVKKFEKIEKDYLQKSVDLADENLRVHAATQILGASASGRMSASEPPYQQFSGPARGILLADEGDSMTSIDWSQIEPVVAANIAKDTDVLQGYETGSSDLYTDIAVFAGLVPPGTTKKDCKVKGSVGEKGRTQAKEVVLAQLYGNGIDALAAKLGVSAKDAKAVKNKVWAAMTKISSYTETLKDMGRKNRLVFTLSGRVLPVPLGKSFDGRPKTVAAHKAVNYTIQGGAYDVLAEACISIEEAGLGDAIYLAVHDELVVSTDAAEDIRKIMETPPQRLCDLAERTPVLRTDMEELGERWKAV